MKYTYKVVSNDKNKTEIELKVDLSEYSAAQDEAYEELSKDIVIPGFRPGKGPKDAIITKIGSKLFDRALQILLPKAAIEAVEKEGFRPIGKVNYDIQKMDEKEGVVYTFSFLNFPKLKLGDLKKIKVKKEVNDVKDEDIEAVIKNVARNSLKPEVLAKYIVKDESKKTTKKEAKGKEEEKEDEHHYDHDHDHHDHEHAHDDLALSDDLVKELGYEKEKNLADLKKSVKERLEDMNKRQAEDEYIQKVIEEAISISSYEIPDDMLKQEVENQEKNFTARLGQLQLKVEDYLKTQGTDLETKRKDWEKEAQSAIASELLLSTVAIEHDILPTEEDIQAEIDALSDSNLRSEYDSERGRNQIRSVMTKRRGLDKLLEMVKEK